MAGENVLAEAFVRLRAKAADNFESEAKSAILPGITRLATDAAGVWAAHKIFTVGKQGLDELKQAEAATAQVTAAIASTGGAAGVSAEHIDQLSQSLLKMSGTDDEAIKGAETMLLRFQDIKNTDVDKTFDRTTKAALDLSIRMGTDVKSAANLLGRALEDPEKGMQRLARQGIILTEQQKDQVKAFQAAGETAKAQGVILDVVEKQVGGAAKAYGETLPGQLAIAEESMKNAKAALVGGLAPALTLGAQLATSAAEKFQELPKPLQETIGVIGLVGGGIASLARPVSDIVNLVSRLRAAHEAAAAAAAAQATADEALAVAETEATVAAGGMSLALAGGLVVAAGAAAYAIWSATDSSQKFTASSKAILGANDQQTASMARLAIFTTKWGESLSDQVKQISSESIPAAQKFVNELGRMGVDTKELQKIIDDKVASDQRGKQATDEYAGSVKNAAGATKDQQAAIDGAAKATESYAQLVTDLAGAMDQQYKTMFTTVDLVSNYEGSVDSLTETLKKNTLTLDLHDKKGRENQKAIEATGQAIAGLIEQRFKETHSVQDATAVGELYVANLKEQLHNAGLNNDQIDQMIATMHLTPEEIATTFSNNAADQQIVVGKFLQLLKDIPEDVQSQIKAQIDQGNLDRANEMLDNIAHGRDVNYNVVVGSISSTFDRSAVEEFKKASGLAGGTDYWRGGWAKVGEQGEEWAWLPQGAKVLPHGQRPPVPTDGLPGFAGGLNTTDPVRAQQSVEDVQHSVGLISDTGYRAILDQRLAAAEQFSQEWYSIWQKIAGIDAKAVSDRDAAAKAQKAIDDAALATAKETARAHMAIHDNQFTLGKISAAEYLKMLRGRLVGLVEYSDEWTAIMQKIAMIEQKALDETKKTADAAKKAKDDAANHQLELLRNEVKYGVESKDVLIAALKQMQNGLEKYSDAWSRFQQEIDNLLGVGSGNPNAGKPGYDSAGTFVGFGYSNELVARDPYGRPEYPGRSAPAYSDPYAGLGGVQFGAAPVDRPNITINVNAPGAGPEVRAIIDGAADRAAQTIARATA